MRLTPHPIDLQLRHAFRISRSTSIRKENVLVTLSDGAEHGLGEAAPSAYYGESRESVLAALTSVLPLLGDDPFDLEGLDRRLRQAIPSSPSARAAIDIAAHDLVGQRLGIPLYRFFGLNPSQTPMTSFTIGLDDLDMIRQKVREALDFPILKVKLGMGDDLKIVRTIREETDAIIRVDANAGWTEAQAISTINALAGLGVEFVEQPLPPDDRDGLRRVRERVGLPIIVDERVMSASDIPRYADCADGINIKLMKCGGLCEALRMIHVARAHGLKVMLGCMIETSIAITAAAHLTPLVDYADLDGHLLIANDPYCGVSVHQGRLILPDRPGLGVEERG